MTGAVVLAVLILPTIGFELMPEADEGEVSVTAELPVGSRIERAPSRITSSGTS